MSGWVKFHRTILEWQWYKDNNTRSVFIHCLLKANFKQAKFLEHTIERGQLVTSLRALSSELGLSLQQIRTSLSRLEKTQNLTCKSTNKFTIITICNYERFQSEEIGDNKQSNNQLTNNQQTNNNNIRRIRKKEEKKIYIPTLASDICDENQEEINVDKSSVEKPKKSKKFMTSEDFIAEGKEAVYLSDKTKSQFVFLTPKQKQDLKKHYYEKLNDHSYKYLQSAIDALDSYIANSKRGKEYTCHYRVLRASFIFQQASEQKRKDDIQESYKLRGQQQRGY